MGLTDIIVEVYGSGADFEPRYRLFLDGYLLTERTWAWPTFKNYVEEHISVDIETGEHTLEVVPVPETARFTLKNCIVNGNIANLNNGTFLL